MFGVSSLGTVSLTEIRNKFKTPQCYQFYFHKDRGLNKAMLESAKEAGVEVMMLTVDTITGGNRERFELGFQFLQIDISRYYAICYQTNVGNKLSHSS